MTGTQVGLYGGYTVARTEDYVFDVLAGLRYFEIDADAQLQFTGTLPPQGPSLNLSQSVDLWDAVVGVKGSYDLDQNWYIPYHFDVGAGDSDLTWQAVAGVGYRFEWGNVLAAWFYPDKVNSSVKSFSLVIEGTHASRRSMSALPIIKPFDVVEHIAAGLVAGAIPASVYPLSLQ